MASRPNYILLMTGFPVLGRGLILPFRVSHKGSAWYVFSNVPHIWLIMTEGGHLKVSIVDRY